MIFMIERKFWKEKLNEAWNRRSLVWLSGVRRSGKTTLAKMISDAIYMNCDLPSVVRRLDDPEFFYSSLPNGATVIFDEIHRLKDPSMVLKIGVDEFSHLKILATGSSTLSATEKFRDSLTGRKTQIFLPPVLWNECLDSFMISDLDKRLLNGGLPELLLAEKVVSENFSEWIDSYYARDIQELFGFRNRTGFINLLKFIFLQSGGILDITSLSKDSGLSRPTVMSHIEALTVAHAAYLVLPFFGGGNKEIVKRPKVYAFDTGFVCFVKGWNSIRETDRGILWEHLALDMLRTEFGEVFYWRDKFNNEIDFVVKGLGDEVHVFECKINQDKFSTKSIEKFREYYPNGKNYCISPFVKNPYKLRFNNIEIEFCTILQGIESQ
jgi:predicted AAA+ superfamily ATPase